MTETRGEAAETVEREPRPAPAAGGRGARRGGSGAGLLARISLYYRQIVAELRKVIRPSRQDLVTYTTVVLVFVSIMVGVVAALDIGFAKAVLAIFG